jgi:transglutaminase-like putative cysteine protease
MLLRLALSALLLTCAAVSAFAGDQAPAWLQQATQINLPTYDKNVSAVVLVDDLTATVSDDGRVTKVYNYAVRILQHEARDRAVASVGYIPETGKVKDLDAWLIRGNGTVKRYGKDQTLDLAAALNDVYNEYRIRTISAKDDADTGMVFGYTFITEDRSVFSQDEWSFQSSNPVINSRYTLILPTGWRAESVTFNNPKVEPKVSGSTYSWELANLPGVPDEPLSPSLSNLVARLAISYYPPTAVQTPGIKTFANWAAVAAWMSELEDPQVTLSDALTAKARELTANARTEYEKIQAIGSYVQKVQYISIQTGLGRGGGYRPHSAAEVFAKSYGDCKDKANLMRAMLKAVGIDAVPISIYSGDRDYVRADWPSPQQFNHCIIAVRVSDETHAATIIRDPKLGRLLIFDPTAEETPVGDLPAYLQGSLALLDSKDADALVQMPVTPTEMNQLERNADLQLEADGSMTGAIEDKARGQIAAHFRGEFHRLSRPEYNTMVERWLTSGAPGSRVSKVEPADDLREGRFALSVAFAAPGYAQLMQNHLLVFKPAIVSRREFLSLTESKRKHPVVLESNAYSETVHVKLPVGFEVDELPDAVKLDTPFGTYATSYDVKDGQLVFKRTLVQKAMTVPVEQYASVRSFFEKIRAAEQAPVVLARK